MSFDKQVGSSIERNKSQKINTRFTVHLGRGAATLHKLMGSIYRDVHDFYAWYIQNLYQLVAGFAFHPSVSFFQIEVSVDCAADWAAYIICFQKHFSLHDTR
ncbi:MAG: hypothetical protein LUI14_16930 [Lachnospiraceae bacterium]|nr:hypothetical protein [Lachnospiraceae bacterium]